MTDYTRMPDNGSKNQVTTALNNSDGENEYAKQPKVQAKAPDPAPAELK